MHRRGDFSRHVERWWDAAIAAGAIPCLTRVVIYDNVSLRSAHRQRDDDPTDATRFLDQGGLEGLRDVPGRGHVDLPRGPDDRGRGRQGRHCQADARHGAGVFEIALPFKGDAFRVIYAVHLADELWVVHAFQKKSTQGIKTPQREIDLIKDRLKRLKEMLR